MSRHGLNETDREFRVAVETGALAPVDFSHRAHVRLAYVYLAESTPEAAVARMRVALSGFLAHHGIPAAKYHETLTRAWILAVSHFMNRSLATTCAEDFIARNPRLLDTRIMLTHYSTARLFSDAARAAFVEPDLDPIPRHAKT